MNNCTTDQPVQHVAFLDAVVSEGVKEVRIAPWGNVTCQKGSFIVDDEGAAAMIAAFEGHGVDLPIDWEHQTLGGEFSSPDGRAPAAGWVHKIFARPGQGIYGLCEWNLKTIEAIREGAYRYLSPVLSIRTSDRRAVGLHSVALTNKPAIPAMERLAAKETPNTETGEMTQTLQANDEKSVGDVVGAIKGKLGLTGPMTLEQVLTAVLAKLEGSSEGESEDSAVASSVRELLELPPTASKDEIILTLTTRGTGTVTGTDPDAELAAMKEAEADRLARALVDKHIAVNRINPNDEAQMQAALSLARENPERFEQIIGMTQPYVAPGMTEAPTSRQLLIGKAASTWRQDATLQKGCSCEAHIALALRDAGLEKMSDEETRVYVVSK